MLTSPILQLSLDRYLCALIFGLFIGSIESGFAKGLNTFSTATHSPEGPLTVSFTTEGSCANTPVMFFPVITPGADRVEWNFGDGNTSSAWAPAHRYGNSGVFLVELTAFLGDEVAHAFGQVNINANDLRLTLVPDTIACACNLPVNVVACGGAVEQFEVPVLSWGGNMPSFQWYGPGGILPDQTSNVLAPDSAGYYYVVATDGAGCSSYAGVSIREYDAPDRRNNLWYFGNGAGIVFDATNGMGAVAITGPLVTPGGSSVMSDRK